MNNKSLLLGYGRFGTNIYNTLSLLGIPPLYVCDKNDSLQSKLDWRKTLFTNDYKNVLDKVDVVYIATPASSHYALVSDCLSAGKHVFCEKPLALSVQETQNLITLAKENNVVLHVDLTFCFSRQSEWLKLQDLSNVISVNSIRTNFGPFDTGVDVDYDLSTHCISLALHFFGMPNFVEVHADVDETTTQIEESTIILHYRSFLFKSYVSRKCIHKIRLLEVHTSKGSYHLDYQNRNTFLSDVTQPPHEVKIDNTLPLQIELYYFQNVLTGKQHPICLNKYLELARVLEAIEESFYQGGKLMEIKQ